MSGVDDDLRARRVEVVREVLQHTRRDLEPGALAESIVTALDRDRDRNRRRVAPATWRCLSCPGSHRWSADEGHAGMVGHVQGVPHDVRFAVTFRIDYGYGGPPDTLYLEPVLPFDGERV